MRIKALLFALLAFASPAVAQSNALQADNLTSFTVLAEPQLALPMTEITRLYSLRRGVSMLTAFDDSVTQAAKLLEGESGDVLITSYPLVISDLRQRGIVDVYSLNTIAGDSLVLAASNKGAENRQELLAALDSQPVLLANPKRYVEGLYGHEAIPYLYYNKPMPFQPVEYTSRSAMYDAIRKGDGIGVLLQSEAKHLKDVDLTVPLAESGYPPIIYHAMVVAGENMPVARDFSEFLSSAEAQRIFTRYGFTQP